MTTTLDFSLIKKFINLLMIAGKKNVAYKVFTIACHNFVLAAEKKKHTQQPPFRKGSVTAMDEYRFFLLLQTAINNVRPFLEGRKCRVGGTTKIVPALVSKKRGLTLAMRWIIESAKKKKKTSETVFSQCLAEELLDAYQKRGRPRQRRDEYHKTCQASRGYLRYRWW